MKIRNSVTLRGSMQLIALTAIVSCAPITSSTSEDTSAVEMKMLDNSNSILFLQGDEQIEAFRHSSQLAPSRLIQASKTPLVLNTVNAELVPIEFEYAGTKRTLEAYLAEERVAGLVVIKNGRIRFEHYGLGNTEDSRWISFSVTKSVVSLLIGAAIKDGYIGSVNDPAVDYLPLLKGSAYEQASIKNVLQMASGVAWNEDYADPDSDVAGANYETLALYEHLKRKDVVAEPGKVFNYNTAETNLAGTLLRSAIGNNLSTYLQEKIWQPFGMESDAYWQLTEPGGGEFGGCCINATLRDYARIGLFAMADGRLSNGESVLPVDWMADSTSPSDGFEGYGYFWWLEESARYQAIGIFGQSIYINPETQTVIAVHSAWPSADSEKDWGSQKALLYAIDAAMDNEVISR